MTERADQLHHNNAPVHSTALIQAFLAKHYITQVCQPPLQPRFGSLRLLAFPRAKIAVEGGEICECDGHTAHKFSQRRLTADWLALRESDCSRMCSRVYSDWLTRYMKATRPVLDIVKMDRYFPDGRRACVGSSNCFNKPVKHCDKQMWFKGKHNGGGLHKE